ncbi:MAG: hypothetical protein QF921_11360 [Pseudomonadales bacterium]|jgi:tetratricopeptide (TPR) repeat protein|nr:hypothetical protein [Pseudomonadales bacterium]MDP6470686.1 hypothetical protein [Pseudomonadales bacterium]MDP6828362.1 hypothetical protein [Pseudomonadales bacterium]MDP6972088.1 hypothetical protein [Pseudomonadales bacterium]|tara:strand:+ start:857 stop:1555 length:699 start_codon:yes stop_codon:yes gene_type:complete
MTVRLRLFLMAFCLILGMAESTAHAASDGYLPPPTRSALRSPEAAAERHYQAGLRHKGKALNHEAKAERANNEKTRDKYITKANKEYAKSIENYRDALRKFTRHYKAAYEMGYALQMTGDLEKAIGAYNFALDIHPRFWEAIEQRGEAFLDLGYLYQVKYAYLQLFRVDQELAARLMTAMEDWMASQPDDSETITEFRSWLNHRKALARMTTNLSLDNTPDNAHRCAVSCAG